MTWGKVGISDALKRKNHDDTTPTRDDLKVQLRNLYLVLAIFADCGLGAVTMAVWLLSRIRGLARLGKRLFYSGQSLPFSGAS
jgi:hypothetical protein